MERLPRTLVAAATAHLALSAAVIVVLASRDSGPSWWLTALWCLTVASTVVALVRGVALANRPADELVRETRAVQRRLEEMDDRGRARADRVVDAISAERAKESRHEYLIEQALHRVEELARRDHHRALTARDGTFEPRRRVLFVTSNGAGLGHISRCLAVSDHLPDDVDYEILTMSTGHVAVSDSGAKVSYYPSADSLGISPAVWNDEFTRYFAWFVDDRRPAVVVFDGTWVYPAVTAVARDRAVHLIWLQRGCWKPAATERSSQRGAAAAVCDEVVVPGDYGCPEIVDPGPGVAITHAAPVVRARRGTTLSRAEACHRLGLDPRRSHVLVNLGGGSLYEGGDLVQAAIAAVLELSDDWEAVVCRSPLMAQEVPPDGRDSARVHPVEVYPIAPYLAAFSLAVVAGGYNSVQECVAAGLRPVVVPNERTITDDQAARAAGVEARGWGRVATTGEDIHRAIADLAHSYDLRDGGHAPPPAADGAVVVADLIAERVARGHWARWAPSSTSATSTTDGSKDE